MLNLHKQKLAIGFEPRILILQMLKMHMLVWRRRARARRAREGLLPRGQRVTSRRTRS